MAFGYESFLSIGGEPIGLRACTYSFEKDIDEYGTVASMVKGGMIYLSLDDIPYDDIISWALEHRSKKSGMIVTIGISDGSPIADEEICFEGGVCTEFKIMFERKGRGYFSTLLTISADIISIGRAKNIIDRGWTK